MYETKVTIVDAAHPNPEIIEQAASLLRQGEVVVFPTETVYGLGANAFDEQALQRIFTVKGRPLSDPLIVHIADEEMLHEITTTIPEVATRLAEAFWPGPLTMILPRSQRIPKLITAGMETVAVRMPRHPVARALIRAAGVPVAAPSANRFMHVSPTTAQHALTDLAGRIPLILDGGACEVGVESTVLDLCGTVPTILRPGGVSLEALQAVVPMVQLPPPKSIMEEAKADEQAQVSPGQLLIHYSPSIPLLLFDGSLEEMLGSMVSEMHRRQAQGEQVGVLIANEDAFLFEGSGAVVRTLGAAAVPEQIAASLFAGLRALEDAGVQVILCRNFDAKGLGLAVRDRLRRAAGGKIFSGS